MAKPVALSKLSKTELIKTVRKLMARECKLLNQLATYETQHALDQMRVSEARTPIDETRVEQEERHRAFGPFPWEDPLPNPFGRGMVKRALEPK